jgi:phosphatidylglycerol:prolipoprotein diacylglycerol transferase
LGFAFVAYAPVRFVLDFLRVPEGDPNFPGASDPRYAGLTPAQWACFLALGYGAYLLKGSIGKPYVRTAPAAPDEPRPDEPRPDEPRPDEPQPERAADEQPKVERPQPKTKKRRKRRPKTSDVG